MSWPVSRIVLMTLSRDTIEVRGMLDSAVEGSAKLAGLKSVVTLGAEKDDVPIPGNNPLF